MNPDEEKRINPIKTLRTYQGDVDELLSKNKTTTTTILVAEQKRKGFTEEVKPEANTNKRNKVFIISGGILLFLGIVAVSAVYYKKSHEQVVVNEQAKTLVSFSKEKDFAIASSTREDLIALLAGTSPTQTPNYVLYIKPLGPDGKDADITTIFKLLAPRIPGALSRSFENSYMFGEYYLDKNSPFIILTTNDYAESYAGMLKWEKDMPSDLGGVFGIPANSNATSTFSDLAFHNKDLRLLKNSEGNTVLLYSFIDRHTLVITSDENTLTSILAKLQITQQTR